ncbi:hypothetical protein HDV00_004567 [Rhizophlyctis rosea]|nr:hypothetical protein HDV00_004567 [Rhizophlyctis rosea]
MGSVAALRAPTAMTTTSIGSFLAPALKGPPPRPPPETLDDFLHRGNEQEPTDGSAEKNRGDHTDGRLPVEAWPAVEGDDASKQPTTERHLIYLSAHISALTAQLHLGDVSSRTTKDGLVDSELKGMQLIIQDEDAEPSTYRVVPGSGGQDIATPKWEDSVRTSQPTTPGLDREGDIGDRIFQEYSTVSNVTGAPEDVGKKKSVFLTDVDVLEHVSSTESVSQTRYEEGPVSTAKLLEVKDAIGVDVCEVQD